MVWAHLFAFLAHFLFERQHVLSYSCGLRANKFLSKLDQVLKKRACFLGGKLFPRGVETTCNLSGGRKVSEKSSGVEFKTT